MDLATYINDPARRSALAAACESNPDYLWQIATGRRNASPKLAQLIEQKSADLGPEPVEKSSLRPDIWPPAQPAPKKKAA